MLGGRCWARVCLWLLAGVWIACAGRAQIGAGALAGDVVDQAGAAVPGATVTVTAVGTNPSRTVGHRPGRRLRRPGARARRLSGARRVERIPAADPRRHPARHRRDRSARPAAGGRRADRSHHGHRRRAAAAQRNLRARPRRSTTEESSTCRSTAAASSRLRAWRRAWRCPAARGSAAAHQRRPAAHQRVSVRRHLGAAARARAGGVLSEHRRDSGVQDRKQQPAGRVRPLQRRRRQPDDQVRAATRFAAPPSSSSATKR